VRPGRSVGTREAEHVEGSILTTTAARSSLFYMSHPNASSPHYTDVLRRGFRSSLTTYFGVIFDPHRRCGSGLHLRPALRQRHLELE